MGRLAGWLGRMRRGKRVLVAAGLADQGACLTSPMRDRGEMGSTMQIPRKKRVSRVIGNGSCSFACHSDKGLQSLQSVVKYKLGLVHKPSYTQPEG